MGKTLFFLLIFSVSILGFEKNPTLSNMAEGTFLKVRDRDKCGADWCSGKILQFSGMEYDHHRHKIISFGGGHATTDFPSAVVEFDFSTLTWSYLLPDLDCASAYTAANALKNSSGQVLGGLNINGTTYAGSRHTYDGLVMLPDTCLLICAQAQEFIGCVGLDHSIYDTHYKGGSGLFRLDPYANSWRVSEKTGLASGYSFAAIDPNQPDWIYLGSSGYNTGFFAVNWRTETKVTKASRPQGAVEVDHSMTYYPGRHSFISFPDNKVYEYNISQNSWKQLSPSGSAPNCYGLNVVYDTLQKVFCVFSGSNTMYYYSPVENRWYNSGKSFSMNRLFHNHVYDPVNNVHVMVGNNAWSWTTYVFKFSDTPGKFPGTGLSEASVSSRAGNALDQSVGLAVSPNPFNSSTIFKISSRLKIEDLQLKIYDINGKMVNDLTSKIKNQQSSILNQITWNPTNLTAGIYLIKAVIRNQTVTKKLFLMN